MSLSVRAGPRNASCEKSHRRIWGLIYSPIWFIKILSRPLCVINTWFLSKYCYTLKLFDLDANIYLKQRFPEILVDQLLPALHHCINSQPRGMECKTNSTQAIHTTVEFLPPRLRTNSFPFDISKMGRVPHVGIVGAGLSGLRCADILLQRGVRVTILEARDRVGGRVCCHTFSLHCSLSRFTP